MARALLPWIAEMWVQMGVNWSGMFEFLEASSTSDTDVDGAALPVDKIVEDPPMTASSLEVGIYKFLLIQQ